MIRIVLIATLVLTGSARALAGQDDTADVLAIVERLFDGMRERDTALLAGLFEPGARLVATGTRNGTPYARTIPVSDFIAAVGRGEGEPWIERIFHPKVRVSDHLATVWTWYTFSVGERLSHCGVDAFQLARGADGWKIVALADTRRTDGCEEVPQRDPDR